MLLYKLKQVQLITALVLTDIGHSAYFDTQKTKSKWLR